MNHLERAKDVIRKINPTSSIEYSKSSAGQATTHALIAIAEEQSKIAHDNASFLLVLDRQLGKIAEQLEKIADQGKPEDLCLSCSKLKAYCPEFKEDKLGEFKTTNCSAWESK